MTSPPVIPNLRPEPDRDRFGRYLLPTPGSPAPETRPWTRATTLAHALDDTTALTKWKRRMVIQGAAADPSVLATVPQLAAALDTDDPDEARAVKAALDAVCDAAADLAGANAGSGWGTALHAVTEWHDAGRITEIDVPIDLVADLAIYEQTLTDNRITRPRDHIERIVVNKQTQTAGTYDRLLRLPDGRLVVGDLKSQQSVYDWLGIAMQLAQYAHADGIYDPNTNRMEPMPPDLDVTRGLVIHLPARSGTCTLYEVDLEQGWQAALLACQVRDLRQRGRRMGWKWHPPRQAEFDIAVDQLIAEIHRVTDPAALVQLWQNNKTTWTPAHTAAAAARKRQLGSAA
jgi:hypothetical protein